MQRIVNRTMRGYKTDFSDYDRPAIEGRTEPVEYTWIVRELGTHLINMDESDPLYSERLKYIEAVRDCWAERKEYRITFDSTGWTIQKQRIA
jgi:hypothetical protein